MRDSSPLFGANASFIEELYEQYLADPGAVPGEWRAYFDALPPTANGAHDVAHSPIQRAFADLPEAGAAHAMPPDADLERKQVRVLQMINAYRFLGVRIADLDPLKRHDKPAVAELDQAHNGLGESDMSTVLATGSLVTASGNVPQDAGARMTLREIQRLLRQT